MPAEMPSITSSAYASNAVHLARGTGLMGEDGPEAIRPFVHHEDSNAVMRRLVKHVNQAQEKPPMGARRLVQVVIVDPNENVPLADCLLYRGEPQLTDATDQELFFEIDIKSMLASHNEKRVKIVDKKVKERNEYLEAAKIRDLKMVVVNIAQF